ncbi:glycosyltransferase [Sphingobium sp. 15-1]|uniref:glycosyltransferase family 2 protein n=1 Tax=Sphingobium sp. 15-1 TaxID=2729616 RepID=UPI00159C400D|nr:glycosyltransferase [Sphingobium sp. 15-1]
MMQLTICIATYNRAAFISETLDSIIPQLRPGVEVVIVDGASPDDTAVVVAPYVERFPAIRYFRETKNSGVDGDYDRAVEYAAGEHCWLFPDDDLLAPDAVDRVLDALEGGAVDLLVVDAEVRDRTLNLTLQSGRLALSGERRYGAEDAEDLLADAGYCLSFIGGVIVRRDLWVSRRREPYFGSLFIHVGVIFQSRGIGLAKILAEPLVRIRAGNAMWRPRGFEIWAFKWPSLIWSFDGYSDVAKEKVTPREPWRRFWWLLGYRALGAYSRAEYELYFADRLAGYECLIPRLAAAFPGRLANLIGVTALALVGKGGGAVAYDLVACSRYSNAASRFLAGFWLGRLEPPLP